jgi:rod shape-determining protein MreD
MVLQTSVLSRCPFLGIIPDLNLIVVTFFSIKTSALDGTRFGFFAGLIQDFLSLKSFGASSLSKTCIGFLTGVLNEKLDLKFFLPPVLVLVNTLINEVMYLLFYFAIGNQKVLPSDLFIRISLQCFFNLLFTPLIMIIFKRLDYFIRYI